PDLRDRPSFLHDALPICSPIGSGGMRSKVVAAEMATAAGIRARIANGMRPEVVAAAFAGEEAGTRFLPQSGRVSSFKLWLKYAKDRKSTRLNSSHQIISY